MLTLIKKIFTWWNQDTIGTRLYTIFFGKFIGKDEFGNRYYQSKKGKRWVIYYGEIDASKIPVEWYSWIHFTSNKIENNPPKSVPTVSAVIGGIFFTIIINTIIGTIKSTKEILNVFSIDSIKSILSELPIFFISSILNVPLDAISIVIEG